MIAAGAEEFGGFEVQGLKPVRTGLVSQRRSDKALSRTGRAGDEQVFFSFDKAHIA